jgi:hypothetical protein
LFCSALGNECLFNEYGFKFLAFPLVQMELGSCPFSGGEEQQQNLLFLAMLNSFLS